MTATHNLNQLCLLEQTMTILNKSIKVILQEEDGVTDDCKSNQVITIIIFFVFFCFVLSSYIYLHSLHYLNNI